MTDDKVKKVLAMYDAVLAKAGFEPRQVSLELPGHMCTSGNHLRYACSEAARFVDEGRRKKAMHWLGFVQGALWAQGYYSLAELMDHNREER